MTPLYALDVQVQPPSGGVRANSGISAIGEGARLAITKTGDVMFVAAESRLGRFLVRSGVAGEFELKGAELGVDY